MSRAFVYFVNSHPFYLRMVANSISMLRSYNTSDIIRLFIFEDGGKQTFRLVNRVNYSLDELAWLCDSLGVEVITSTINDEKDDYFLAYRHYLKDCQESTIFYLDADTFIFGDPAMLFDKYKDVDVVACYNGWVNDYGYSSDVLPINPFNTGVVLCNNYYFQKWCTELPELCDEIVKNDTSLSRWLYSLDNKYLLREELSLSVFTLKYNLNYKYFVPDEVRQNAVQGDMQKASQGLVFHSFTDHWKETFNYCNQSYKPKRALYKI